MILIHAYSIGDNLPSETTGFADQAVFADFVKELVSQGIAHVSVPLFFLLSGYFFFLSPDWSLSTYKSKLASRVKTLLIPFVFWNLATLLMYALAQRMPFTSSLFSGQNAPISSYHAFDYLNALIGLRGEPMSYQFWFIRDLMVMVLFTPLLYWFLRTVPKTFLALVFTLWILELWPLYVPCSAAVLFFSAGSYLALLKASLFRLDKYGIPIAIAYAILLIVGTIAKDHSFHLYIDKTGILFGIVAALYATQYAQAHEKTRRFLTWAAGYSFYIFAVHEPFVAMLWKIAKKFIPPHSSFTVLILYFGIPLAVITGAFVSYQVLKSIAPKLLRVISGGR